MEELLQHLEKRIRNLIEQHHQLRQSNQQLYQSKFLLVHEKEQLSTKQKKAIKQIQILVSKLKEIEKL